MLAGFAVVDGTRCWGLVEGAERRTGETRRVRGGGGGGGWAAVEIGKAMGARVIAAASTDEKLQVAAEAGADDLEKNLPEEAMVLYGKAFTAMREAAREFEKNGIPPDRVAKFVEHALTAKTPKTRYVVGFDAQIQRVITRFPDRISDRLVAQQLKLPRRP